MVDIYFDGVRVAKGTGYDYDENFEISEEDTFDGTDVDHGEFPKYTVKVSRIETYNSQYETILKKTIEKHPDGIPITVADGNIVDKFTGCYIESRSVKRDPKSKRKIDFSFKATGHTEERK